MMGFDIFGFLRRKAREAILGGCSDALSEIAQDDTPADLEKFRLRLAAGLKSLPAAQEEPEPETIKTKKGSK